MVLGEISNSYDKVDIFQEEKSKCFSVMYSQYKLNLHLLNKLDKSFQLLRDIILSLIPWMMRYFKYLFDNTKFDKFPIHKAFLIHPVIWGYKL